MTSAAVRRSLRTVPGWAAMVAVAAVVAAPVLVVLWSVVDPSTDVWRQLWRTRLPGMLVDTVTLLVVVVAGTLVLGTALAWLVTAYRFPGRRVLGWLLVAPLAVPGYVLGFVWLDTLQEPLGARAVRSIWICAGVLILSLYPYVYLFARAAFAESSRRTVDVARSLGASRTEAWWRITLPMARPSLAAGAALVAMEVLTDVGTVRLFNVSTVADGVLRVWFGNGDRNAAAELSVVLVVMAVTLVAVERLLRGRARFTQAGGVDRAEPRRIGVLATVAAIAGSLAVLTLAVGLPIARLVGLAGEAARSDQTRTVSGGLGFHLVNTIELAAWAAACCLALGLLVALLARGRGAPGRATARLATLGYAVPGPVVAVGVVVTLAAVDRRGWLPGGVLLVGSMVGLVYAVVVRFLAVGYQGIDSSLAKVPPNAVASARALGAAPWRVAARVELPLARAGILAAAALVAVDAVKELPVTLLLRPFGGETLSVWVWQATSESLWAQAAVPSLAMVAVAMVPVGLLLVALERGAQVTS